MSDSELATPASPIYENPTEISPRKSIRRIHQDLRCFVIGANYQDVKACQNAISQTMKALVKHGEEASSIAQARKYVLIQNYPSSDKNHPKKDLRQLAYFTMRTSFFCNSPSSN